jgi:hypothetical protein
LHRAGRSAENLPVGHSHQWRATDIATFRDANVGLVHVPIEAGPAQMFLGAFGQFGAELLDPAVDGRAINGDPALFQKVDHIRIGE